MRLIDADALNVVKFHPLPYTHIVPADLLKCQTEAYERGWNDAIDAIIENAETVEERKTGRWKTAMLDHEAFGVRPKVLYCSECNQCIAYPTRFCPNCGCRMTDEQSIDDKVADLPDEAYYDKNWKSEDGGGT